MGIFNFEQFSVDDSHCGMKIGTDAVLLGAWADVSFAREIVDVGCGSGVIALMMAQRNNNGRVLAVDVNHDACLDAIANTEKSPWADRVEVIEADITKSFPSVSHPLLIVSNPPFFNEKLRSPDAGRALARHGDEFTVKELIEISAANMTELSDSLAFIAPTSRTDEIDFLLSLNRLSPRRVCTVYSREGKASIRTLWQVGLDGADAPRMKKEELYIRNSDNSFTRAYIDLTSEFYLDK